MSSKGPTRRQFIQKGLAAAGALAIPAIVPSHVLGMNGHRAPGDKINLGFIGLGGKGFRGTLGSLLHSFVNYEECHVKSVCDVYQPFVERAKFYVDDKYGNKECYGTQDFRELIYDDEIDAVVIATPDHWHAVMSIMAFKQGKDVYVEKAMANTLEEVKRMQDVAYQYDRIVQVGSQSRSNRKFNYAIQLIRQGAIGDIKRVRCASFGNPAETCYLPAEIPPEGLDWDMWLGPAPWRPYHNLIRNDWRRWRDYGGAGISDRGAHHFDLTQWGLSMSHSGPVEVLPPNGKDIEYLTFRYANGVEMFVHWDPVKRKRLSQGTTFFGSDGEIMLDPINAQTRFVPESLNKKFLEDSKKVHWTKNVHGTDHYSNFLKGIRTRERCNADVAIGARSTAMCILGNLAYYLNRPIQWDPKNLVIKNDPDAQRYYGRAYRQPWGI